MTVIINGTTGVTFPDGTTQADGLSTPVPVADGGTGSTSLSTITVGNATNATNATTSTNLAGGGAGQIPYQSASGTTAMLAAGTSGYVLTSQGTSAPTWTQVSSSYVGARGQVFTSSGTFTVPTGVTAVKVTLTGGGGGGSYSGNGTNGGTSSFGGYVSASGGGGGGIASGGAGGTASGADFSISGQSGMDQGNSNSVGGACGFDGPRQSIFTDVSNYIAQQGMLGGLAGTSSGGSATGYGNGGYGETISNRRSGGGSAYAVKYVTGLTAGSSITVTVGARGTSGNSAGNGTQGIVFVEW